MNKNDNETFLDAISKSQIFESIHKSTQPNETEDINAVNKLLNQLICLNASDKSGSNRIIGKLLVPQLIAAENAAESVGLSVRNIIDGTSEQIVDINLLAKQLKVLEKFQKAFLKTKQKFESLMQIFIQKNLIKIEDSHFVNGKEKWMTLGKENLNDNNDDLEELLLKLDQLPHAFMLIETEIEQRLDDIRKANNQANISTEITAKT